MVGTVSTSVCLTQRRVDQQAHPAATGRQEAVYTVYRRVQLCNWAILAQLDSSGREHVVANSSRILKGAEIHYGTTEKECLSVVVGIKKFRVYLYGTRFKVFTDCDVLDGVVTSGGEVK